MLARMDTGIVIENFFFPVWPLLLATSPRPYDGFTDIKHISIFNERFIECSSALHFEVGCDDVAVNRVFCQYWHSSFFVKCLEGQRWTFFRLKCRIRRQLDVWLGCWRLFLACTTNWLRALRGGCAAFEWAAWESRVNYRRHSAG